MGLTFNTPLVTPIPGITQSVTNFRIDQITRMFLIQLPQSASPFADIAAIKLKANWDTLIAASDITKVIYTPVFSMPKITNSARLEIAKDSNQTFAGIPMTFAKGTVRFSAEFLNKDSASMKSMDAIFNYSQQNTVSDTNLGVVLVNSAKPFGQFFHDSIANFVFIPIYNFMLDSRGTDGFAAADKVPFAFDMLSTWADNLICTIPAFDPNTVYRT